MNKKRAVLIISAVLVVSFIAGCGGGDKNQIVRDGHWASYPQVKIGDAYDGFFKNGQWKYFEGEKGAKVVEFTGNCLYKDKEITVRQQFLLGDGNSFTVGALAFNDIDQDKLTTAALISKIYDEYYKQHPEGKTAGTRSNEGLLQKAQNELSGRNVPGTVVATSVGNSANGFLSLVKNNGQYSFIICDKVNQQIAQVPFDQETYNFFINKNQESVIFTMTIFNDGHDRDEKNGTWYGENHLIPVYAGYKLDSNGNVIPGMLTTGVGAKPSHYQGYLNERKNVDTANLVLTEMKALKENAKINQVAIP